jgi:hypothetical protein
MKRVIALGLLVSLVLVSPCSAILRPRYPAKPSAPGEGRWIILGDDTIKTPPQK